MEYKRYSKSDSDSEDDSESIKKPCKTFDFIIQKKYSRVK